MATSVTLTNLESEAYNNIFSVIDTRSNVADPRDPSGTRNRVFVYDSDPFHKGLNFNLMPYIVLHLPTIEQDRVSSDGKYKFVNWTQRLLVRTVRTGSSGGGTTDTGRTDIFAIGNDLFETFNSETVKTTLRGNNLGNMELTKVDSSVGVIDEQDVYEAEYELIYQTRMKVSN